jgi:hypothetical protein
MRKFALNLHLPLQGEKSMNEVKVGREILALTD